MATKIRLKRTGTRNAVCYRIVVIDGRSQRDGKAIEELGFYDPRHNEEQLNLERAEYWLGVGAQASETVTSIIERVKSGKKLTPPQPKKSKKAVAKEEALKKEKEEKAAEAKAKPEEAAS